MLVDLIQCPFARYNMYLGYVFTRVMEAYRQVDLAVQMTKPGRGKSASSVLFSFLEENVYASIEFY